MPTSLSDAEQKELERLLEVVVSRDKGFIPDSAYPLIHKLVPWPAVEVLIYDDNGRFALTYRDDTHFKGWHIPGGYLKVNESYGEACDRIVRKEKVALGVAELKLIASHTWLAGEHPYGYPVSMVIACRATDETVERDGLRWFLEIPPDVIIQQHPKFLTYFKEWFKNGARPTAAII